MADKKLLCEVVTPDRVVFDGEVDMVIALSVEGEVGILPLHAPYLTALGIGEVRIKFEKDGRETFDYIVVTGGFMEVFEDKVTILAPAAELAREIDIERAKTALERAEATLRQQEGVDMTRVDAAIRRAQARIKASGRIG